MSIVDILRFLNKRFPPPNGCSASLCYVEEGYRNSPLSLSVWSKGSARFIELEEDELNNLEKLCADIDELLINVNSVDNLYTHTKSGKTYRILFEAIDCTNSRNGTPVVVYKSQDSHNKYVRELDEFNAKFQSDEQNE